MSEEYNGINPKTYARIKNVAGHHFALFVAENRIVDANNSTVRKSYADARIKTLNKGDLNHFVGGWIRYVHYRKESYKNRPEESKWLNELQYIKETYTSREPHSKEIVRNTIERLRELFDDVNANESHVLLIPHRGIWLDKKRKEHLEVHYLTKSLPKTYII